MTDDTVLIPGGRDVRATLDRAADAAPTADEAAAAAAADACVVACPPHPQHRGHRGDQRLRAVSDALTDAGVDCLRFDYGEWDEGYGECADARNAAAWAADRYESVGLFGFSFGGCVALLTAADDRTDPEVAAVSALAPTARLAADLDCAAAVPEIRCPVQVVYGARDDTADWEPVVDAARDAGADVTELAADHFFVGQADAVGDAVGSWLAHRV
ncbi:alpha/beta hydrolase [Halobaculum sp. D14]|uniref:alpha/beta hydrolase n=1 Tax=unclassified Halobaculum TaxID=2640896 RepID=UPI003EC07B8D